MNIYNLDGTDKPIKFLLLVILWTTFALCWKIQNSLLGGLIILQLLWPILVITLYEIFLGKGSLLDRFRQTSIGRTSNSYKNHIDDLWYIFFLNIGDIRGLTIIFTVGLSQVERSISTIFDNFYNQTLGRYLDGVNSILILLILILIMDFADYLVHRVQHEVPFFLGVS